MPVFSVAGRERREDQQGAGREGRLGSGELRGQVQGEVQEGVEGGAGVAAGPARHVRPQQAAKGALHHAPRLRICGAGSSVSLSSAVLDKRMRMSQSTSAGWGALYHYSPWCWTSGSGCHSRHPAMCSSCQPLITANVAIEAESQA